MLHELYEFKSITLTDLEIQAISKQNKFIQDMDKRWKSRQKPRFKGKESEATCEASQSKEKMGNHPGKPPLRKSSGNYYTYKRKQNASPQLRGSLTNSYDKKGIGACKPKGSLKQVKNHFTPKVRAKQVTNLADLARRDEELRKLQGIPEQKPPVNDDTVWKVDEPKVNQPSLKEKEPPIPISSAENTPILRIAQNIKNEEEGFQFTAGLVGLE